MASSSIKVIAVLNQKGGVGKTTLATNLAAAAYLAGKKTLILDLDSQGSALDWYHARSEESKLAGLATLRADRALAASKIRSIGTGFDQVFIDGPPRLGKVTRSAATAADLAVIPVKPGAYDLWALQETLATLDEADATRGDLGIAPLPRVFVLTQAVPRTNVMKAAPKALGAMGTVSPVVVHSRVIYPESASRGESVLSGDANGPGAVEIKELYRYLLRRKRRTLKN